MPSPIDAIYFVLTEAARFQRAFEERRFDVLDREKMDAFWTLPSTNGRGDLICGKAAGQQLFDAMAQSVECGPHRGRIDLKLLYEAYKREIMLRFVDQNLDLSEENADAAFQAALAPSLARLSNFTHIIPCHLVMAKNPDRLELGPVTFWRRENYWSKMSEMFAAYEAKRTSSGINAADVSAYYGMFDWLAEVHVANCEENPSEEIAERMAWSAIDCVQLVIGTGSLERMTLGGVAFESDRRSHIILQDDKIANLQMTVQGRDVTLGDETWRQTELPDVRHVLDLMATAIAEAFRLPRGPIVSERFIDAVHWFGLAMRDTAPASRLIMMIMAIERFLLPLKVSGIESVVRSRSEPFIGWDKHNRRVQAIYEARGKLAHGQLSARAPEVIEACRNAQKLAQAVLVEALSCCGLHALRDMDMTLDMMERSLVNYAKASVERRKPHSKPAG